LTVAAGAVGCCATVVAAVASRAVRSYIPAELLPVHLQLIKQHIVNVYKVGVSSGSLPSFCICTIEGSVETSVVTFVAAFAEAEEPL
jgi:hypothetical protein